MSTRRHHHLGDDGPRHYRDVAPASAGVARETIEASAIAGPGPSLSFRATTYSTSHVRNDNTPGYSLPDPEIPRDARERVSVEREPRKRSTASLTKDQGSVYSQEREGSQIRDEAGLPKEEGHDRQDTPRGVHYPSLKENLDIHRPPLAHAKDVQPVVHSSASFQHIFESQSRELSILQNECRVAVEEKKALTDAYATLRQQYDERYKKLISVRQERQTALAQRKEVDDAYMALKGQYDEQTQKLNVERRERQAALEQKQKAEEDYATLRQKYETQKNDYHTLSNKYQSLKAVLEQRTSELQGVQKFFATADTFSGSEVVNMLRKLNEEVQQSMTVMAESAVESFMFEIPSMNETAEQSIEQTRVSETLGTRFMQMLGMKKHKDNPILLEMAFRAYLTYELYWVASPWSIGEEEQAHNLYVDGIYQRIRDSEGQAVSGNWRALTRAYTLPACISDPEVAHTFDTTIVTGFSDILVAAGCTASKSDIMSTLWSKFGDKVHHFVSLAGQVNKIIGVGVISEDFEVLVIWPDTVYDERAMEDAYDNGNRVQGPPDEREEIVLCATELGLLQRMSVGGGSARKGKSSELIVIKPKVALLSVTDIVE